MSAMQIREDLLNKKMIQMETKIGCIKLTDDGIFLWECISIDYID